MEKTFNDEDALDSILENSVVELDAALSRTQQQEELVSGLTEETIAAFSKQLPTTPTHHDLHHTQQQFPTELFVDEDQLGTGIHPFDTVVSESTLGSPSDTKTDDSNVVVYWYEPAGSVALHPHPQHPTSGSCVKMPSTASPQPSAVLKMESRSRVPMMLPEPTNAPSTGVLVSSLSPQPQPLPLWDTLDLTKKRVGRWTLEEKILFLYGLRKFGKGHWKQIQTFVPGRTLIQIKSHGQKVLKRMEAGENVFRRLEEHADYVQQVVARLDDNDRAPKRPRRTERSIAASALCQLGDAAGDAATANLV